MDTLTRLTLIAMCVALAGCLGDDDDTRPDANPDVCFRPQNGACADAGSAAIDAGSGVCMAWCQIHHSECLELEWFVCVRQCDADPTIMEHCGG